MRIAGMGELSDQHIFQMIQQGDIKAFNILFDKYYTLLCFFACRMVADMDASRSLVQEVFIDLWVKKNKISINYSLKSYLYQSVRNRTMDYFRTQNENHNFSELKEENDYTTQRDLIEEAELAARINDAFDQLPEKCREIFLLCKFNGMKYAEIADKLEISVKTVEMQMGIAFKKLRKSLYDLRMVSLFSIIFKVQVSR